MMESQNKQVKCPECGATGKAIIKNGNGQVIVARKMYKVQRYRCNRCYRTFACPSTKKALNG